MIVATFFGAVQALFVKLVSDDLSVNFLVFARCLINFILFFIWQIVRRGRIKWHFLYGTKRWKLHAIRSMTGMGSIYCFYHGVDLLSLSLATLLTFSFPLFVPLIARLWLKVAFAHRLWSGLLLAFIGIIFALRPGSDSFSFWGAIPLFGAMLIATGMLAVRRLHHSEPSERIMAYFFTIGAFFTALVFFLTPSSYSQVLTSHLLLMTLLIGVVAAIFQTLLTVAMKYAPARLLSPFIYMTFIFSALFDFFIFHKPLYLGMIIGSCLIIIGTILTVLFYPKDDLIFKEGES